MYSNTREKEKERRYSWRTIGKGIAKLNNLEGKQSRVGSKTNVLLL